MKNEAVIIYAAGKGSRFIGLESSKCILDIDGTTSLRHTIATFSKEGITDFYIVIGYCKDQVKQYLTNISSEMNVNIETIENTFYDYHGCEYSIALGFSALPLHYDCVYLAEGDVLIDPTYVKAMSEVNESAALLRDLQFINKCSSVVAVSYNDEFNRINKFVYDPVHENVYDYIDMNSRKQFILGESLQLWKFVKKDLLTLVDLCKDYVNFADTLNGKATHTGLFNINILSSNHGLLPVFVEGTNWINLNSYNEYNKAVVAKWLLK